MKKLLAYLLVFMICTVLAVPATAASLFAFTEKTISLYEGESVATAMIRQGVYEEDAEITYASTKPAFATVSADGTITAVSKGIADITATMYRDGKKIGVPARVRVNVLRAVKKVTLNTTKLSVYDPGDPAVADLLWEQPMNQIIVIPAGTSVALAATCTPEDASSVKVTFTSSDAGVAKVAGTTMRAMQRGECELTVASAQNPDVTETFCVLVIQPVKKITIEAGDKKVAAGSSIQLSAVCSPDNASIKDVTWISKTPQIATVDAQSGVVTGLKKGSAVINAIAADGSKVVGAVTLSVTQSVESVSFAQNEIPVVVGRTVQARANVLPASANDKTVTWSSDDESIATVKNGQITGKKAGRCTIVCRSNSNPEIFGTVTAVVSQLVTSVQNINNPQDMTIRVGETVQTLWSTQPEDATNKGLTFKSLAPKVATVDANGLVTAVGRGVVNITATAQDTSKKQGSVKVTVIQPVTGVSFKQTLYYIQLGGAANVRATVEPKNANNQKVYFNSDDEWVATVRSNGTSTGLVSGQTVGYTTIRATTEDGGFTASTQVRIGNFNDAVMAEALYVNNGNDIKIVLRNMSQDIVLENIHYRIECFDTDGNPMICNTDGENVYFEGDYPYTVYPQACTTHGNFRFKNYVFPQRIGRVVLTVLSWKDSFGVTYYIPDGAQKRIEWADYSYHPQQNTGVDYGEGEG